MLREQVQGLCALHCRLALMNGVPLDKKAMRFSAMADYVEHVIACSAHGFNSVHGLIWEAVATAIVGHPMHILGQPFDRDPYRWMEDPTDRAARHDYFLRRSKRA
jgi:hypothetical protein